MCTLCISIHVYGAYWSNISKMAIVSQISQIAARLTPTPPPPRFTPPTSQLDQQLLHNSRAHYYYTRLAYVLVWNCTSWLVPGWLISAYGVSSVLYSWCPLIDPCPLWGCPLVGRLFSVVFFFIVVLALNIFAYRAHSHRLIGSCLLWGCPLEGRLFSVIVVLALNIFANYLSCLFESDKRCARPIKSSQNAIMVLFHTFWQHFIIIIIIKIERQRTIPTCRSIQMLLCNLQSATKKQPLRL